jgi:hypothetical protein
MGGYSFVAISTLLYINLKHEHFIGNKWIVVAVLALVVFMFFNFPTNAKCFAGDAGGVNIAYIIILFIIVLDTNDFKYIFVF